jgi:5-formyltetrahydrofolate cyclo-ligase
VHAGQAVEAALSIAQHGVIAIELASSRRGIVSGYWPMRDELDARPLLETLVARGWRAALPAVMHRGDALQFRAWRPGDALIDGGFGTSVPPPHVELLEPDVLIVPMLAFDGRGYRLGYGGGYYDRSLAVLRARRKVLAIGVAYDAQRIDRVPNDAHDQPLDLIVTENGAIDARREYAT